MTRSSVLAAGAVVLAAATLTSCGFDYTTDRDYTPAAGNNDRSSDVDVLAAVIVSKRPGSGTFVAGLSNGSTDSTISVESLAPAGTEQVAATAFDPIEIPAGGYVNLATVNGIELTGDFTAGDFRTVAVKFDNGQTTTLDVPVVTACDEYADLDISSPSASPSPSESATLPPGTQSPGASTTTVAPTPSEFPCDAPEADLGSSAPATAEAGG